MLLSRSNRRASQLAPSPRHLALLLALVLAAPSAWAAPATTEPIIVTGKRRKAPVKDTPAAVTVLSGDDLSRGGSPANDVAGSLGTAVSGLGLGSSTRSTYGQTLRGRTPLILIDGIPQGSNRSVGRDFAGLEAYLIQQVEVVRGANSLYGSGGAGGVINVLTLDPTTGGTHGKSRLGAASTLTGPAAKGASYATDHVGSLVTPSETLVIGAGWRQSQARYDADGREIPPDPAQIDGSHTRAYSLFAKGKTAGTLGALTLSVQHAYSEQQSPVLSDLAVLASPPGTERARARSGLQLPDDPRDEQTQVALSYQSPSGKRDQVQASVYGRRSAYRFFPSAYAGGRLIAQSQLEVEVQGVRSQWDHTLDAGAWLEAFTVGIDLQRERSRQPTSAYDPLLYAQSQGRELRPIGAGPTLNPPLAVATGAAFAQMDIPVQAAGGRVRLGVREEQVSVDVDDFVAPGTGAPIEGGERTFNETLPSLGLIKYLTPAAELFANYGQSFTIPDVGAQMRNVGPGFRFDDSPVRGLKTASYDLGGRLRGPSLAASGSLFYSRSDRTIVAESLALRTVASPETIYGAELDYRAWPVDRVTFGQSFTYIEGRGRAVPGGKELWLSSIRVPPPKLVSFAQYDWPHDWTTGVTVTYAAGRARGPRTDPNEPNLRPYVVADLAASWTAASWEVGAGIDNVLNKDYRSAYSQLAAVTYGNPSNLAAAGRSAKLSVARQW